MVDRETSDVVLVCCIILILFVAACKVKELAVKTGWANTVLWKILFLNELGCQSGEVSC
jgi:hypothetical protein